METMPPKQSNKLVWFPTVKQLGARLPAYTDLLSTVEQRRLKELEAFQKEHGHCNVPSNYPPNMPLARWVSRVRTRKNAGAVATELVHRLDGLGFTWVLRRRAVFRRDWDTMIAALTAFKNQHGHCCVPMRPGDDRALGMWLVGVRRRKKAGILDRKRVRQLDKLGLVWEPQNQRWEDMFADLLAYRAKYGNCIVPSHWPENPRLASWVHNQRQSRKLNTLAQDRFERLDQIEFSWTRGEETWESKFAALVEYKRIHGDCQVSTLSEEYASLGNWVRTMREYRKRGKKRRGTLSDERIRRLTQLGFVWDGALKTKMVQVWDRVWESRYAALAEYQRTHGHCRVPVPSKEHTSLARWVHTMRAYRRQGKLSKERIRRLTQLGFVWDGALETTCDEKWERMLAALVKYKEAHGNCDVPSGWPINPKLASWVNTQRTSDRKGTLSPKRRKRLEAIGFRFRDQETACQGKETSRQSARPARFPADTQAEWVVPG